MISRRTAKLLGQLYEGRFSSTGIYAGINRYEIHSNRLYDFLYENDHSAWLCNSIKRLIGRRSVQEFVMQLHTGESLLKATQDWTWDERKKFGQKYLEELSEDILILFEKDLNEAKTYISHFRDEREREIKSKIADLKGLLELDGYEYKNGHLYKSEANVVDIEEVRGVLESLYLELRLDNKETAIHHLSLSEDHYLKKNWDDSISNSRKFLECVAQEAAAKHSLTIKGNSLNARIKGRPVEIRAYLENEKLLDAKEVKALAEIYGLLSHTGGHPYMAASDQARLLRNMALTFSQFILIRLKGCLPVTALVNP